MSVAYVFFQTRISALYASTGSRVVVVDEIVVDGAVVDGVALVVLVKRVVGVWPPA
jgi:hypothetical protein